MDEQIKKLRDAFVSKHGLFNAPMQAELDRLLRVVAAGSVDAPPEHDPFEFIRLDGIEATSIVGLLGYLRRVPNLPAEVAEQASTSARLLQTNGHIKDDEPPTDAQLKLWIADNCEPAAMHRDLHLKDRRDCRLVLAGYRAGWAHALNATSDQEALSAPRPHPNPHRNGRERVSVAQIAKNEEE